MYKQKRNPNKNKHNNNHKNKNSVKNNSKGKFNDSEILSQRVLEECPHSGDHLFNFRIEAIKKEFQHLPEKELHKKLKIMYTHLPISQESLKGLRKKKFYKLTEIQRCVIPHALAGRDILGASKTGSGKTLAYLVPLIEKLHRNKWTVYDGLGALVLVPTRELALQVFEVLRHLSSYHEFSFGLVVGGKSFEKEAEHILSMNILVATPGRLLQHFEETYNFNSDNLQFLVLDEADEILSMGFEENIKKILEYLPRKTQVIITRAVYSVQHSVNKSLDSLN